MNVIKDEVGEETFNEGKFHEACDLFINMVNNDNFDEFLTIPAYNKI